MKYIKKINEFINENNSQRISNDDGIFYSVDEVLNDWRKNGYNYDLNIEDMCYEFDEDYDDFREDLLDKMTDDDFVLMVTKIHYPPIREFNVSDFIEKVCETSKLCYGEGEIEDTFGVDPYQSYTFGGNFEGTVQLNDELKYCSYGYESIKSLNKQSCKGISKVTDYIINNVNAEIYYADRQHTWSYEYKDDDLYICEYQPGKYWYKSGWISKNIKMYIADLCCEGDPNRYLILCCEN